MKIIIDGDIGRSELIKIGALLSNLYHGRKEHINVDIEGWTESMNAEEVLEIINEMLGGKPNFKIIIHPENCRDTPTHQQHLGTHPEEGQVSTETDEEKGDSYSKQEPSQ